MFIESFLSVENDLLLFANKLYMAETKLDFPGLFQLILLLNVKLFGVVYEKSNPNDNLFEFSKCN